LAFDPIAALREAGVLGDTLRGHEEYYSNLSQDEVATLISMKERLPEVQAHSADWAAPEAAAPSMTEMACACGAWSGSGSSSGIQPSGK